MADMKIKAIAPWFGGKPAIRFAMHLYIGAPQGLIARDGVFLALAVHGWFAWGKKK